MLTVSAENACLPVARRFLQWLVEARSLRHADTTVRLVGGGQGGLGHPIAFSAAIFLRIDINALEAANQAYTICVRDFGVDVVASDPAGLFYACATLVNLITLSVGRSKDPAAPLTIPTLTISDWPSMRNRALYLDVSRKRIPTLGTLKHLVTFMAKQAKLNQLHLNVLPNFDRLNCISREAMFRHEDILELNRFCNEHFVELIPVIAKPTMSSLSPDHVDDMLEQNGGSHSKIHREGEASREDEMLYDEFLPLFDSEQVHLGNSEEDAHTDGIPDFANVRRLLHSLRSRGKKTLHMFGNRVAVWLADEKLAPSILPELPGRTLMTVEVGDQDVASFNETCLHLRRHGLPFYACASSCLESSISGRLSMCLSQSGRAVSAASAQGAVGVVLKDGSLCGDGAPLVFLYQSLLAFGGAAWNAARDFSVGLTEAMDVLPQLVDMHVFMDPVDVGILGSICVSMGDLHIVSGDAEGDALRNLLSWRDGDWQHALDRVSMSGLRRAVKRADRVEAALSTYEGLAERADVVELRMTAILTGVAARLAASLLAMREGGGDSGGVEGSGRESRVPIERVDKKYPDGIRALPDGRRSDLCNQLLQAIELMREGWMARFDKLGFIESVDDVCGKLLNKLAEGMPYQGYLEERRAEGWIHVDDY